MTAPAAAELVYEFQPLTPHGTAENAAITQELTFPNYEVVTIQWVVPPGPQGNLGWQLMVSGETVIPQNGGWIITDNEKNEWAVGELPTTGAWGFKSYNTGSYDHTVYLRFLVAPLTQAVPEAAPAPAQLIVPTWPTVDVL